MFVISLVGEQPIPILLPLRYLQPKAAVLVHTDLTAAVAKRLERLLQGSLRLHRLPTDPYDIGQIQHDLKRFIAQERLDPETLAFNLTGGTKTMMLATYEVAREYRAPFLYLQSEGRKSLLYRYRFENDEVRHAGREEIPPGIITIDDYLRAHVGNYQETGPAKGPGGRFESAIADALKGNVDEVLPGVTLGGVSGREQVEVDLVARCGNQVGVISAKTGNIARKKIGLDQLRAACGREYLGTYTGKMLVINQTWPADYNLRYLADAWGIRIIELPSFKANSPSLSDVDRQRLVQAVRQTLGG